MPTVAMVARTSPIVSVHAPMRRRMRTQRGRFLRRLRVDAAPVRGAPVREAPVRVPDFASRLDVPVGRGRCWLPDSRLRDDGGMLRGCDPVGRRLGGFLESVTRRV